MILTSSHRLRRSTYSMSNLIHSWKSAPALRVRLTCHRPVMPGRTLSRASRQAGQYWFSARGLGRGPGGAIPPPGRAVLVLGPRAGAGADDRHLADQHVPELRQLVQVVLAQQAADLRQA